MPFLSTKTRGIDKVQSFIGKIQHGFKGKAMEAINEYLLHQIQNDATPPYSYVSRSSAYGQTFQSDAQRRWFFANGGPDMIGNNRTGEIVDAWQMSKSDGTRSTLYNTNDAAKWLYSDTQQARQPALVGWPKISDFLAKNLSAAIDYARNKVQGWVHGGASDTEAPGL